MDTLIVMLLVLAAVVVIYRRNSSRTIKGRNKMKNLTSTVAFFGLLILVLAIPVGASSTMWSQTYGGPNNDLAEAMIQTSDGGYALAGYTWSFSDDNSALCWLIKVDSSGNMEWNKTYGGQETSSPSADSMAMIQTSDGGYALSCFIAKTLGNEIDSGFWLFKVDSSGNMEWNQKHWREGLNHPYSLVQTADGGYALAGQTASFGAGEGDAWLIKTDEYGIVPEFPSWTILPLVVATTLIALYLKKKIFNSSQHYNSTKNN